MMIKKGYTLKVSQLKKFIEENGLTDNSEIFVMDYEPYLDSKKLKIEEVLEHHNQLIIYPREEV